MLKEPVLIVVRRFRERAAESVLLVAAVALGTAAFATGLSLLINTRSYAEEMLESPLYREIIVSTHEESAGMVKPAALIPVRESAVLTSSDLAAAELAPGVSFSYVRNRERIHFITGDSIMAEPEMPGGRGMLPEGEALPDDAASGVPEPPEGIQEGGVPRRFTAEELHDAEVSGEIIISKRDDADGFEVTADFFNSWNIDIISGSGFSLADYESTDSIVLLGRTLADEIAGPDSDGMDLVGKKLLSRQGYRTVTGIFNSDYGTYNSNYFSPYRDRASITGMSGFRGPGMNTRLIFTADSPEKLDETEIILTSWFQSEFGENQVLVTSPRDEADRILRRNTGISLLILFLSMAGLFTASVNVSNILMSRTLRMKKNVGILMAMGASRLGIVRLLLAEAVIITLTGTAAGAVFAVPLSGYIKNALGVGSWSWVFLGAGAAASALLVFLLAMIPALQFSNSNPVLSIKST